MIATKPSLADRILAAMRPGEFETALEISHRVHGSGPSTYARADGISECLRALYRQGAVERRRGGRYMFVYGLKKGD
jgi:hypothetical protein